VESAESNGWRGSVDRSTVDLSTVDQGDGARGRARPGADGARNSDADLAVLLGKVRASAAAFLADVPVPPQSLRVRAGEVSIEANWDVPAAPLPAGSGPLPPGPGGHDEVGPDVGYVFAPSVGTFYRAPAPGARPFVEVGDTVVVGQQVAIVEAMKLMIPVESDRQGRVVKVCCDDGASVEYGEPLLALAPTTANALPAAG
jgi:acetyl-CoA carboxylase biotin carboxyl carrier protein